MLGEFTLFKCLVEKSLANDRSAKRLLIITTTLDGFSLANCRRFAKFTKLSRYTEIGFFMYITCDKVIHNHGYKCNTLIRTFLPGGDALQQGAPN